MTVYVALLRGINVGGSNLIKMPALAACFETLGLCSVKTYIQSGNVVFASRLKSPALTQQIEKALSAAFAYQARVFIRSLEEMRAIVARAPRSFGTRPPEYRYDVVFLRPPLTADVAMERMPIQPGVDRVFAGDGVLYCSRLASRAAESRLSRIMAKPIYQNMTIRNWNTTRKLAALMETTGVPAQ